MDQRYYQLIEERPELFSNKIGDSTVKIIIDPNDIRDFEIENNVVLGVIYQDQYIILLKDLVTHPNGKRGTYIRIISATRNSGVVILPILDDCIIFLKHFRHSTRSYHYEIPRGFGSDDLSVEENAAKELFEETGYSIRELRFLGRVHPDTGLLSTQANVYAAYVDVNAQSATDEEEAVCSIELIKMEAVKQMVASGEITDGYSLSALALYWANKEYNH